MKSQCTCMYICFLSFDIASASRVLWPYAARHFKCFLLCFFTHFARKKTSLGQRLKIETLDFFWGFFATNCEQSVSFSSEPRRFAREQNCTNLLSKWTEETACGLCLQLRRSLLLTKWMDYVIKQLTNRNVWGVPGGIHNSKPIVFCARSRPKQRTKKKNMEERTLSWDS